MLQKILLFIAIYLPFQFALSPTESVDLASIRIIIPVLFLIYVADGLKSKHLVISKSWQTAFILSFLFFNIFSIFFAENITWSIRKLAFLLSVFPLYFITSSLLNQKDFTQKVLRYLVIGAGAISIIGIFQFILQFVLGIDGLFQLWSKIITPFLGSSFAKAVITNNSWLVNIGGKTVFRATGLFPDPHMMAFYLEMLAPVALGLALHETANRTKRTYFFLFFIICLAGFLTFSRGGYLGFIFSLTFFFLFYSKQFAQQLIKLFLLSAIILAALFIFPNPIGDRLKSSFDFSEGSNTERIKTWGQSVSVAKDNLLFGSGIGNYALKIKPTASWREPIYSHNLYLDLLAEIGIFGLLFWMSIILFSTFTLLKKHIQKNSFVHLGLCSGIIAFSIHSLFETALYSVHILPLLIILLSINPTILNAKNESFTA